jgi:hypothetical protein
MLLITLVTVILVIATILFVGRAKKAARASGAEDLASRADAQRFLAENWTLVEQTARETGMSEEEIARVRANVLGVTE